MECEGMRPLALYARVSTQDQADREVPVAGQFESLRAWAAQHNYHVVREFADEGKSGYAHAEKRDGLHALIAEAKLGAFATVAIWKLDRFARNLRDGLTFLSELSTAGVQIVSVTETGATDASPSGEFQRNILLAFAEFWSRAHGENVRRGMRAVFNRGGWPNVSPPYGYKVERRDRLLRLVRDAKESPVVTRIFLLAAGGKSLPTIAKALNADGIHARRGGRWTLETIRHTLRSETYLGHRVGRFGRLEDQHEPIVTRATFDAVQELLSARRRLHLHPRMHHSSFLLSWCSYCAHCGARVRGVSHKCCYYACSTRVRLGVGQCSLRPIRKESFEKRVIEKLRERLFSADSIRDLIEAETGKRAHRHEDATLALMSILRRERTIVDAIVHGADASKTRLTRITEQIAVLEAKLAANAPIVTGNGHGTLDDIARRFRHLLDCDASQEALHDVISRITVRDSGLEVRVVIPTAPPVTGRIVC